MSDDEAKAVRLVALKEAAKLVNESRGYAPGGRQNRQVAKPNNDKLLSVLTSRNDRGLPDDRLQFLADRLTTMIDVVIAERDYDGPVTKPTRPIAESRRDLSEAEQAAIDAFRTWAVEPNLVEAVERTETSGRPAMPALDDLSQTIGAIWEELTGRRPARTNPAKSSNTAPSGSVFRRGGKFLEFAQEIEAAVELKFATERRIVGTVEMRKRAKLKFI